MVHKTLKILALLLLTGSLYAASEQPFIGIEVGYVDLKGDTYAEVRHKGKGVEYGLRVGAQNDEWRTTVLLNYFNSDKDDQNVERGILSLDYFFLSGTNYQSIFKPFIGVSLGYANYESTTIDDSDFIYGGQGGIILNLLEQLDMDVGYRYMLSASDVFDNQSNLFLGINYLY